MTNVMNGKMGNMIVGGERHTTVARVWGSVAGGKETLLFEKAYFRAIGSIQNNLHAVVKIYEIKWLVRISQNISGILKKVLHVSLSCLNYSSYVEFDYSKLFLTLHS